jgi:hypothetical protein
MKNITMYAKEFRTAIDAVSKCNFIRQKRACSLNFV